MKKLLAAIPAIALGATMLGAAPAGAAHDGNVIKTYTAELDALNAPGGGDATVVVNGTTATVTIEADGLSPDAPHAQHVHGAANMASVCPTMADDADGDGFVSVVEGAPRYGGVLTSLTTEGDTSASSALAVERFPVSEGGAHTYERTFELDPDVAFEIGSFAVVLHGADLDDSGAYDGEKRSSLTDDLPFEATVPTACGELELRDVSLPDPYDGTDGTEGQISRYYAAMLNRAPDTDGFGYWVPTARSNGAGAVANAFAASAEFDALFGDIVAAGTDEEFVDWVYGVTFGRMADDPGKAYWVDKLATGAISRGDMIALFADSEEFQLLTGTS